MLFPPSPQPKHFQVLLFNLKLKLGFLSLCKKQSVLLFFTTRPNLAAISKIGIELILSRSNFLIILFLLKIDTPFSY